MVALVDDWVQTLGMSHALARSLRLPLHLTMQEFLEDLPDGLEEDGASVRGKLRAYLDKRHADALELDPVGYSKLSSEYLMFGNGRRSATRMVDKMLSSPLHDSTPTNNDHADLLDRLSSPSDELGVRHYQAGGRVKHLTHTQRSDLAAKLKSEFKGDYKRLLFFDDELKDWEDSHEDVLDMIWTARPQLKTK